MDVLKNNIGLVVGGVLTLGVSAFLFFDATKRSNLATKYAHATINQINQADALLAKSYPAKVDGEDSEVTYAITGDNEKRAAEQSELWKKAVAKVHDEFAKFNLKDSKAGLKAIDFSDGMIDSKNSMVNSLKSAGIKLGEEIPLLSFGAWINIGENGNHLGSEMIPVLNRRLQVTKEIVRIAIASKVASIDSLSWPKLSTGKNVVARRSGFSSGRDRDADEDEEEAESDEPETISLSTVAKWLRVKVKVTGDQANVFAFMNAMNQSKVIMAIVRDFKIEAPNEFKVKEPVAQEAVGNFRTTFDNEEKVELTREDYKLDLQQTCSATLNVDVVEVKAKQKSAEN